MKDSKFAWTTRLVSIVMAALCGAAFAGSDTTVPANGTLILEAPGGTFQNRASQNGNYRLIANNGARLVVPTKESVTNIAGFATFTGKHAPAAWPETDSDWFDRCDYLRVITTDVWRLNNGEPSGGVINSEYCSAFWTVAPEDAGTYSFWENFQGNALIALDGVVLLRDTDGTAASAVQGITVSAGVHELTLAFGSASEWSNWGPANNAAPAIRFCKMNADLLADPAQGVPWSPNTGTLHARFPDWATRYSLMNTLVVNGRATLTNSAGTGFSRLRLTGGLTGGGTLVVEGCDRLEFGEMASSADGYPIFDGDIVFGGDTASSGRVVFTNMVSFAYIPTGDQYDFSQVKSYALNITEESVLDVNHFAGKTPTSFTVAASGHLTMPVGAVFDVVTVQRGGTLVLGQDTAIRDVRGAGTLIAQDGATVKLEYTDRNLHLTTEGTGRFELADPTALIERDFSKDISLWFDASAGETLVGYRSRKNGETTLPENYTHYTNGYPIIEKWLDRRASQRTWCAFNSRHFKYDVNAHYPHLYPYVVSNGLNGLNYISCGGYGQTVASKWAGNLGKAGAENRRLPFTYFDESRLANIEPIEQWARHVIMVFGSQQGGGSQIIGRTDKVAPNRSAFRRTGATLSDPFMENGSYQMWTNAVSVDASTACPNGGWQVLSIDCTGGGVRLWGLGWGTNGTANSGGQNYAEVLIFTNDLLAVSRQRIERYLARKWGLEDYPEGGVRHLMLSGGGSVAFSNETVVVEGGFTGTVEVQGSGRVRLAPQPPDEAAIAQTAPLHWFDPSAHESMVLSVDVMPGSVRPDNVWGLFDRRSEKRQVNDFHLYAPSDPDNAEPMKMDRRPHCVVLSAGGSATNWLDYANASGDTSGNTLRLGKLKTANQMYHGNNHTASGNNQMATSIRTGFLVQDSSRGGGVPFLDTIGATGQVKVRANVNNAGSAIYAAETAASLKSGRVWLNGCEVNPATEGFTGAPEVFTFETTNDFPFLNYAYYNGDGGEYKGGQEVQGESLLYATVLPDATRREVEAYLAYKWLGRYQDGYGDWRRGMTFQGTGTVALPVTNLVFAANKSAGTLSPTYDFGTLGVEAEAGVFEVDVSRGLAVGVYPLVRGGDLSAFASWTVNLTGGTSSLRLKLIGSSTELALKAFGAGAMIIVR